MPPSIDAWPLSNGHAMRTIRHFWRDLARLRHWPPYATPLGQLHATRACNPSPGYLLCEPPMAVILYHNPRCSKSRQTLELLRGRGIEPQIIEYLKTPPSVKELDEILKKLGMQPRELLRTKEEAYANAALDDEALTRDQLLARMVANPSVIERPIAVNGPRAALGRPPEAVLAIL